MGKRTDLLGATTPVTPSFRGLVEPIAATAAKIVPPTREFHKRKRARVDRESDGLFSFFTRGFYRNSYVPASDDDNNDTEDDSDHADADDHYAERGLRRVTAIGVDTRANDVLLRVARAAAATANVVFFPGDVQDFHASMMSGTYAEYEAFSYEHTAELLAAKFGDAANVWIVRPSRFQFGAFACFDGFVDTNKVGAATSYPSNGSAVEQLVGLMENARAKLDDDDDRVQVSTRLPVHLVGFSKGGVVLNQLATELATRWRGGLDDTPDRSAADNNQMNHDADADTDADADAGQRDAATATRCRRFASLVASIHWLDSGNGSKRGAVPVAEQTLRGLSALRPLQLCVHVTPFQFDSRERPWIRQEVTHFVRTLQRRGANHVRLLQYAEDEAATLACHFQLLREFHVPLPSTTSRTKMGHAHSPEVALQPVAMQTRV